MNTLLNIEAFLVTARAGSFSAAARELGVAPSVITKRITRLEDQMGTQLFLRSTRRLRLTAIGEAYRPRYQLLVGELEEAIRGANESDRGIEGHLRVKAPTTVSVLFLGEILSDFHARNPGLRLELVLVDRSVNPLEEGFDIAIGALPTSYVNVVDEPLCPYPRTLCATPGYLARKGRPRHPNELVDHECLTMFPIGTTWTFQSERGPLSVEIRSKFNANDSRLLLGAARRGIGLAVLPEFMIDADLAAGRLVRVLEEFPVAALWLKALVPRIKADKPAVRELVRFLKAEMQPVPPWQRTTEPVEPAPPARPEPSDAEAPARPGRKRAQASMTT